MSSDIIFATGGKTSKETSAFFFAGPYQDFCRHLKRCAVECGDEEMKGVSEYAARDDYLDITWMDPTSLKLVRKAAHKMLSDPDPPNWEEGIANDPLFDQYSQQQQKTRDEMLDIIRKATADQLKHLMDKLDGIIAAK